MTESQRKSALEDFKSAEYEADGVLNRAINLFKCDTVISIEEALQAPQVEEVTVDQLVLRFKLTNAEYLINQLSFDHPQGIRIIREKNDE